MTKGVRLGIMGTFVEKCVLPIVVTNAISQMVHVLVASLDSLGTTVTRYVQFNVPQAPVSRPQGNVNANLDSMVRTVIRNAKTNAKIESVPKTLGNVCCAWMVTMVINVTLFVI